MIFNSSKNNRQTNKNTASINHAGSNTRDEAAPADTSGVKKTPMKPAMPNFNAPRGRGTTASYTPNYSSKDKAESRKLIVGKDITMSGEIAACDYLVVEGTVEATVKNVDMVEVNESGTFKGTIETFDAVISGHFNGDIIVKGHLAIRATGSVKGNVTYGDMVMENGAILNGTIKQQPVAATDKTPGTIKPVFNMGKKPPANEDTASKETVDHDNTSRQEAATATIF